MKTWTQVAQLVSSQGLKGRFIARSVQGLPFLLEEGMNVHFVPPTLEGPRNATVSSVEYVNGADFRVTFKDISDRDTSERLMGSYCVVKTQDLPDNYESMVAYGWQVIGLEVVDEVFGNVGTITQVEQMPTQDLLIIQGPFGEVMLPYVDDFILDVDEDEGAMHTRIPSGLIAQD